MAKKLKKIAMELSDVEKGRVKLYDTELTMLKSQIALIAVEIARLTQLETAAIGKLLETQREAETFVCEIVRRLGRDPETETWDLDATTMTLTRRV